MDGRKRIRTKYNREWRLRNPDKMKAHRRRHKAYNKKYLAIYRQTVACKYSSLKSRATKRNIHFLIPREDFIRWFKKESKICHYCGKEITMGISGIRKNWLTIDRKNNKFPYVIGNIVISCYKCNLIKADDISYETMILIGKILKVER